MAIIYADEAPAWDSFHATHKAERVNHSEEYATGEGGIINTDQMESFFSRQGTLSLPRDWRHKRAAIGERGLHEAARTRRTA